MRTVLCGLIVFAVGCGTGTVAPGPKVYDREEFKTAVEGKTQEEVLKLIGTPDRTSDTGPESHWYYNGRTRDKLTGKIDGVTTLWFKRGTVESVHF